MTLQFKRYLTVEIMTNTLVYTIADLRIDFDVNLTIHPEPNNANITIYNLSSIIRDSIGSDYRAITISGGYDENGIQFFKGNIVKVKNRRIVNGWATEIEALDGHGDITKSRFDRTFAAGTPVQTIIAAICSSIGIPFEMGFIARNNTIICGTTYEGTVFKVLNRLCAQCNLKWSIQGGVLEISDKDAPVLSAMVQYVILSPDTGLIGSPEIAMADEPEKGKPVGYITATSLLNPKLLPDRPVMIAPAQPMTFAGIKLAKMKKAGAFDVKAKGFFRVESARFVGSNKTGGFYTEINCPIM
jgi:hypothetical protein